MIYFDSRFGMCEHFRAIWLNSLLFRDFFAEKIYYSIHSISMAGNKLIETSMKQTHNLQIFNILTLLYIQIKWTRIIFGHMIFYKFGVRRSFSPCLIPSAHPLFKNYSRANHGIALEMRIWSWNHNH